MINYKWDLRKEENQRVIKEFHKSPYVNFMKFLQSRSK